VTAGGPTLTGLLLAGGQARRLGGHKATVSVGGQSLLERAADLAQACCDEVLLLAGERELSLPGVRRLPDLPGVGGPLAGLAAGLEEAGHGWCLLLSCDQPFLSEDHVTWLKGCLAGADSQPLAVVFQDDHGLQPFCGLYHRDLLPILRARLADGERSLRGLLSKSPHLSVSIDDLPDALASACSFDVDTPADLARARERCPS